MRRTGIVHAFAMAVAIQFLAIAGAGEAQRQAPPLNTPGARLAYAFGLRAGERALRIAEKAEGFDTASFLAGVGDGLSRASPRLKPEETQAEIAAYMDRMEAKRAEEKAALTAGNIEEGKAFLEKNAKRPGVTVTPSGLQFELLAPGEGPKPLADSVVKIHVRGLLLDGTAFLDTRASNRPRRAQVNSTVPAWSEALLMMPAGARCRIACPPHLAAGVREPRLPLPESRGQGLTLIFEMEVLAIGEDAAQAVPQQP